MNNHSNPTITIIGGPNGAGKSTFFENAIGLSNYINGDEIKRKAKNDGFHLDTFSLRIHIRELINNYVRKEKSFTLESNLVSNYSYDIIRDLSSKNYFTQLIYIGVEDVKILNERIAERVVLGKHYVSPSDVTQRYKESLSKLPANLKLFDEAVLIDNTRIANPMEVLQLQNGIITSKIDPLPSWLIPIYPIIDRLSKAYEIARLRSTF